MATEKSYGAPANRSARRWVRVPGLHRDVRAQPQRRRAPRPPPPQPKRRCVKGCVGAGRGRRGGGRWGHETFARTTYISDAGGGGGGGYTKRTRWRAFANSARIPVLSGPSPSRRRRPQSLCRRCGGRVGRSGVAKQTSKHSQGRTHMGPPADAQARASLVSGIEGRGRRPSRRSGSEKTVLGTPDYLAPELLLGTGHGASRVRVDAMCGRGVCGMSSTGKPTWWAWPPCSGRQRRTRGRLVGVGDLSVRVHRGTAAVHGRQPGADLPQHSAKQCVRAWGRAMAMNAGAMHADARQR